MRFFNWIQNNMKKYWKSNTYTFPKNAPEVAFLPLNSNFLYDFEKQDYILVFFYKKLYNKSKIGFKNQPDSLKNIFSENL